MRKWSIVLFLSAGAATASAADLGIIRLFEQFYRIQRFDYVAEVNVTDPAPPNETGPLVEVEGFHWLGDGQFLMSSDAMDGYGLSKNMVVRVDLEYESGRIVGLKSEGTVILVHDPLRDGWDLDVAGISVNIGESGLAAGGNLLTGRNEPGFVKGYAFDGTQLEWPVDSGCLDQNQGEGCGIATAPHNENMEDVAYVPVNDGELWTIADPDAVARFTVEGEYVSSFSVGDGLRGEAKGITFVEDKETYPPLFHGRGGVAIVALDDEGPALEAFDLDGNLIDAVALTDDGTSGGRSLLDLGEECSNQLQLESLGSDPQTGRLFLVNQSDGTSCGALFVLTPLKLGDMNCDGSVDFGDIDGFVLALIDAEQYKAEYPECDILQGDFDSDGAVTFDDIDAFVDALIP